MIGMWVVAALQGVLGNAFYAGGMTWLRRLLDTEIRIASPESGQYLENDPRPNGNIITYQVTGSLKHLPKDHAIWLLRQPMGSDHIYPQGFAEPVYNAKTGIWNGRMNGNGKDPFRIIAVVAPPTSIEFFRYYQNLGNKKGEYEPLSRLPVECKNRASVQVRGKQ